MGETKAQGAVGAFSVIAGVQIGMLGLCSLTGAAQAQLSFKTYQYGSSTITTVTGIRGGNMTGNYSIPGTGGNTGGLLFGVPVDTIGPFPTATANQSNYPGALSSTPMVRVSGPPRVSCVSSGAT